MKLNYILLLLATIIWYANPLTGQANSDCTSSASQIVLDVNNVSAPLLGGGDMWRDFSGGNYVVPKVTPPTPEVSAIYVASIWMGGYDTAGNLKMAAQTYRQNGDDYSSTGKFVSVMYLTISQIMQITGK